jgi:hypothetical protein
MSYPPLLGNVGWAFSEKLSKECAYHLPKIRRATKSIEFKGEKMMMARWGENVVFQVLWIHVGILYPLWA